MSDTKHCRKCAHDKPVDADNWYMRQGKPVHPCKSCWRAKAAELYKVNAEELKRITRENRKKRLSGPDAEHAINRERELSRQSYARTMQDIAVKEARRAQSRAWYEKHKDRKLIVAAEWRKRNPEKVKAIKARRKVQNIDRVREIARISQKKRRQCPLNRLNQSVSSAVSAHLKSAGIRKRKSKYAVFGWSMQELKTHLTQLLDQGMTWENYGEWHVDHIIPLVALPPTSEDDRILRVAWSLSNLAPLWGSDNESKSDSLDWQLPQRYTNSKLRAMYDNRNLWLALKEVA